MKRSPVGAKKRRPPADWVHQFLIVLANTDPLIWRRIQVPEAYSFWDLHVAFQDAMGWLDCHLHEFTVVLDSKAGRIGRFGIPVDDMLEQPPVQPDWTVKVSDVLSRSDLPILYVYDFGDDWHHAVMYEGASHANAAVGTRGAWPGREDARPRTAAVRTATWSRSKPYGPRLCNTFPPEFPTMVI